MSTNIRPISIDGTKFYPETSSQAVIMDSGNTLEDDFSEKLSLSGGEMTGPIALSGDPSLPMHAVTKQYVDNAAQIASQSIVVLDLGGLSQVPHTFTAVEANEFLSILLSSLDSNNQVVKNVFAKVLDDELIGCASYNYLPCIVTVLLVNNGTPFSYLNFNVSFCNVYSDDKFNEYNLAVNGPNNYTATLTKTSVVPTKTSDLTNDSGFITSMDVPEGAAASQTIPAMDGNATIGVETAFARGDHIHPHDTSKVDVVNGKQLSTEDYTTAEKTKLSGIENGANNYSHPSTHSISEVSGLQSSLDSKATVESLTTHNTANNTHNDIRLLITGLTNRLNALADSDDTTLDQLSEIVAYIQANRGLIEGVTTNKVNVTDVINNLVTNVSNKPLSAEQGVVLKSLIDSIDLSTKVDKVTGKQLSTEDYTSSEKTKLAGIETHANNYSHPVTHDLSMITDTSADNVFTGDHKINEMMYFKNNNVANISNVYSSGFYGTKNTDSTTPYAGYWFVAVFCKDPKNKIAVQWAMNVGKDHNGELWMRTVRLDAATTGDGNMVGAWQRVLNQTYADTLYATASHLHAISDIAGLQNALDEKVNSVIGKQLSTEDYTTAEKIKLSGISAGAQNNIIEAIKLNGVAQPITNKAVDLPIALATSLGLVKSSNAENQISVGATGVMEVNSLNVNKLVQTAGETLIMNCGGSYCFDVIDDEIY